MTTKTIESQQGLRQWVARITGIDPRYGLSREFVNGIRDYGSRNVKITYSLADGLYEISIPVSRSTTNRYFVRIAGETSERIDSEQALAIAREM